MLLVSTVCLVYTRDAVDGQMWLPSNIHSVVALLLSFPNGFPS